jgi:glycosidase
VPRTLLHRFQQRRLQHTTDTPTTTPQPTRAPPHATRTTTPRNALAYVLFSEGIPYIYYGTEAAFTNDREPLWHGGYNRQHPMWLFLRISVAYRKEAKVSCAV